MRAVLVGILAVVALLSLYFAAYFMWVSATPLTSWERDRVAKYYYFWLIIFLVSIATIIVTATSRKSRPGNGKAPSTGFPVEPKKRDEE